MKLHLSTQRLKPMSHTSGTLRATGQLEAECIHSMTTATTLLKKKPTEILHIPLTKSFQIAQQKAF